MALFGWFDASAAEAFAREIGTEFSRHYPPGTPPAGKDADQKLRHAIEILGNRAAKFNRQHPMGWYRKARFARTIKEGLIADGGTEELADRVVYAVVVRMARRDETGAKPTT
jgi:hypothetical protein